MHLVYDLSIPFIVIYVLKKYSHTGTRMSARRFSVAEFLYKKKKKEKERETT